MRIPFLLIAAPVFLASSAWAQDDEESPYYVQLGFGAVFSEEASGVPGGTISFDPGFSVSAAVGRTYEISERLDFDAELEAFYQAFAVDEKDLPAIASAVDDSAKTFALMLNGGLDWKFTPQYAMYGALGIGWAKEIDYSSWDSGNLSISDTDGLAYQGRFGFAYNLGGTYDVRMGYRYFKTEPVDIDDLVAGTSSELDVAQHSLEVTFRWGL